MRSPALLAVTILLAGCAVTPRPDPVLSPAPTTRTPPPAPSRATAPSLAPTSPASPTPAPTLQPQVDERAFRTSFDERAAQIPGRVGIAVAPVGGGQSVQAGGWSSGVAWSTSKVPLAIAAARNGASPSGPMHAAIVASDNDSADQLWAELGPGGTASQRVEAVISDFGGGQVDVPSQVTRPGYTAYGQTDWSLQSQAEFAARLPCRPEAGPVLTLMSQVDHDQRWGLGTVPGARFKGGWGPGPRGGYLVRQVGIITTPRGEVAVAVAVEPRSGDFAEGTRLLGQLSGWLVEHPQLLPAGRC